MSYYDTLGDFSGVPPRRHSSASELLSAYGGYVSDPEVLEEVDPADQSASMQRANVVTAAADEDHGYGDSFEQPTADMYTVMAPLADQRPPAIVSNMSYNSGMTTWGGEPVFSSPESAALSPQAASAVSRDFTFQNFKRYDDEQKIEAVKSTPPPDHVSNVGIVRQSSVRSNSSSEGSPPPSPVYQPRMRVASTTKSRPQPIDDASSDRVGGYMPQFSTEKKPRSLSIINRALIPTIPVSPDPSEEPAPALDTPQQETRPNVEAYSVEVAEKASINLVAASTERVFRAEGDTEDDQYDLDFSTELDPVPQSHHPEDYEELPHNSPAPIEAIPTEAEEPVASEFVGEMELDSKRPLEEEELAEADEEIVSMRNQAPASSLGSSSCANEPSGHEYDEEWEDEEGEDDVIEEGRGGAAPASSVAMVTANVVALETAKPRSADLSSTEFKFSKRFLEKKGIKRKVLSQKKPVSSQKPRRMSEDNRGSDRVAVQSAPRRPAVPRFQHRSREGKASALKEGGLALELKLEAHKEDIDEAMRKKLLSDIDQAKVSMYIVFLS